MYVVMFVEFVLPCVLGALPLSIELVYAVVLVALGTVFTGGCARTHVGSSRRPPSPSACDSFVVTPQRRLTSYIGEV
jgi:hypothetical protein